MSQTISGPGNPYYLTNTIANDKISFNKLSSPPLAPSNKGILYELSDGKLYFNGVDISSGGQKGDQGDKGDKGDKGDEGSNVQITNIYGMANIDGSNQILLGSVQLTPSFVGDIPVVNPFSVTTFRFNLSRALVGAESINIRLLKNGTPVHLLGSGSWGLTLNSTTPTSATSDPFSVSFVDGDNWSILINSWTPTGGALYMSYILCN